MAEHGQPSQHPSEKGEHFKVPSILFRVLVACADGTPLLSGKTLILCYVTIPPAASITEEDWLRPERLLSRYSVREVTIRRFVPARMRD